MSAGRKLGKLSIYPAVFAAIKLLLAAVIFSLPATQFQRLLQNEIVGNLLSLFLLPITRCNSKITNWWENDNRMIGMDLKKKIIQTTGTCFKTEQLYLIGLSARQNSLH